MKRVFFICFILSSVALFAQEAKIVRKNWKVYKDSKLLFEGDDANKQSPYVILKISDDFKLLKFYINSNIPDKSARRKLLFRHDDKLIYTVIFDLKSAKDPITLSKAELIKAVGSFVDKPIVIEYADDEKSEGTALGTLYFKD